MIGASRHWLPITPFSQLIIASSSNVEGKLELENVLVYLRGRVTFQWYKFGAALGVPSNVLEKFIKDSEKYSEEKALNKVLRYWLKNHPTQPSWQEVSNALRDIIWMS